MKTGGTSSSQALTPLTSAVGFILTIKTTNETNFPLNYNVTHYRKQLIACNFDLFKTYFYEIYL